MRAFALLPLLLVLPACGLDPVTGPTDDPGPVTFGALTLSMESIDFGDVAPDDSGLATLSLTNTGDLPLTILDAKIDTSFFLVEDAGSMLPSEIAAGGVLDMNILFTPDREMDFEGTLTIVTDDVEASEVYVTLSGSGVAIDDTGEVSTGGQLSLSTSSIDFGEVPLGTSYDEPLSITNGGDEDVLIINLSTSDSMWIYGGELALPYVLAAGETRDVSVIAEPAAEGSFNGLLTVQSDATNPSIEVPLSASSVFYGTPILELICDKCESSGNLLLWITKTKSLTLANNGDAPLVIDSATLTNASNDCGTVSMSGWGGKKTLSPGSTHDLTFTFSPGGGGQAYCTTPAELTVSSDGGTYTKTIKGQVLGG